MSFIKYEADIEDEDIILDAFGSFWDKVKNTDKFETIWRSYMEAASIMLRRLYQLDVEASIQDITGTSFEFGDVVEVDSLDPIQRIKVEDDTESIPEIHSRVTFPKIIYEEGQDYEIISYAGNRYIDFTEGEDASTLSPINLGNDNQSYIYYPVRSTFEPRVYKKFGNLLQEDPPRRIEDTRRFYDTNDEWNTGQWDEGQAEEDMGPLETEQYIRAVKALWYAVHFGPTIRNIRVSLYVLHGLPVSETSGIIDRIREVPRQDGQGMEKQVRVDGSLGRDSIKFRLQDSIVSGGVGGDEVEVEVPDNDFDIEELIDITYIYRNMRKDDNFFRKLNSDNYLLNEDSIILDKSVYNELEGEHIRLIFNYNKKGRRIKHRLGGLELADHISEGQPVEKFDIFTKEIKLQDMNTKGEITGTRKGEREWRRQRRPPGLYSVLINSNIIETSELFKDVSHFLDRFEPIYSHFEFKISEVNHVVNSMGHLFQSELLDLIQGLEEQKFPYNNVDMREDSADLIPTEFFDEEIQNGIKELPFWDMSLTGLDYYDRNVDGIENILLNGTTNDHFNNPSHTADNSHHWDSGYDWDPDQVSVEQQIHYDDGTSWDQGDSWDQGGANTVEQPIPYIYDYEDQSESIQEDSRKTKWDNFSRPHRYDYQLYFN